jgi:hypothetical protein
MSAAESGVMPRFTPKSSIFCRFVVPLIFDPRTFARPSLSHLAPNRTIQLIGSLRGVSSRMLNAAIGGRNRDQIMENDNRFPTGEWNGFYLESHRSGKGWMHLYLQFEDGKVSGEGTDYVGPWTAAGEYDSQTGVCSWVKSYLGKHRVFYGGTCGSKGIVGEWSISGGLNGPFHIWPRTMGDMNELYLTEDLTVPTDQVDFSLAMAEEDSPALV